VLRGSIGHSDFSPELYEEYGKLLLSLADTYEAGKYLLLAGNHLDEYTEAIDLYLSRNRKRNYRELYSCFPTRARLATIDEYPEQTRARLEQLGFPRKLRRARPRLQPTGWKARILEVLIGVIAVFLVLAVVVGFLHGASIIVKWLWGLFR